MLNRKIWRRQTKKWQGRGCGAGGGRYPAALEQSRLVRTASFHPSPEVIGLMVMMYVRLLLSLRNVEDLSAERGVDMCRRTVRMWWNRFGPIFAEELKRWRVSGMRMRCAYRNGVPAG